MAALTVDEYVQNRVLPQYHPVVTLVRELMRECAPAVRERISYDMPVFEVNKIIAYIYPSPGGVTFSFVRGIEFSDPYGLLKGRGKSARHVKLKKPGDANLPALRDYIRQALEYDAQ